jgi:hypothetical protein
LFATKILTFFRNQFNFIKVSFQKNYLNKQIIQSIKAYKKIGFDNLKGMSLSSSSSLRLLPNASCAEGKLLVEKGYHLDSLKKVNHHNYHYGPLNYQIFKCPINFKRTFSILPLRCFAIIISA